MEKEFGGLPEGWVNIKFGEVVEYGKASKKTIGDVDARTWILELEDIEKDTSRLISRTNVKERPFKSTKNAFKKGDVLYGKLRPYLNKIILADADGVCTTEIIPIDAEPLCSNRYVFYWLKNSIFLSYVNDVSYGVNMPRLGTVDGQNAPFRLAPRYEQDILASKLDSLLAQVDSIKTRLDQIPQILKRFRQAVLSAAVSGKLTGGDNSGHIKKIKLDDFAVDIRYGTSKKCSENPGATPVLRIPNIGMGKVLNDNLKYADFESNELKNLALKEGDLLLIRSNGSVDLVGKVAVITKEDERFLFAGYLIRIRLNMQQVVPQYIAYCLQSPELRQVIENVARSTSGVNNINSKEIASLEIPCQPLEEQTAIVARVEKLFAWADNIEKQVNAAQQRVNNLTQSILAKAFRGELTEQWRKDNPDLISGENSAAALLEKIKAEREAVTKKSKKS